MLYVGGVRRSRVTRKVGMNCGRIRVAELIGLITHLERNLVIKLQPPGFLGLLTPTSGVCVLSCAWAGAGGRCAPQQQALEAAHPTPGLPTGESRTGRGSPEAPL